MTVSVHYFDSTGEAYDASQTDEQIHDGDVLVVKSERAVAVLVEAWPVAVDTGYAGREFHPFDESWSWSSVTMVGSGETHDYTRSYEMARAEARGFEEVVDAG